ncbi:2'-5' RNA ligase family protein [Pedobacter metabolipauper]|uniref:2'-5' RNA ligase n=1 Tax=Pedobacter metabolipauper TaxID=425513 RepID=A0A4R6SXF7_9SPHI|nr:2'-5' RNA ligase family protein [Pedobacter metabolipauper]TDQ10126.1 2'-5' RNA ligase [Pedobacter metabolipauper]
MDSLPTNKENDLLYQYLLVFSPDEKVNADILAIKKEYRDKYDCKKSAHLKPHLTLINFHQFQSVEIYLIKTLEKLSRSIFPIPVNLCGFGQYPPHTIYIKVINGVQISELVKTMRSKLKPIITTIEKNKPVYMSDPHLTIARGMSEQQFNQAWPEWKQQEFKASFNASGMLLIKRRINKTDAQPPENYQVVKYFQFTGTAHHLEQLNLFEAAHG